MIPITERRVALKSYLKLSVIKVELSSTLQCTRGLQMQRSSLRMRLQYCTCGSMRSDLRSKSSESSEWVHQSSPNSLITTTEKHKTEQCCDTSESNSDWSCTRSARDECLQSLQHCDQSSRQCPLSIDWLSNSSLHPIHPKNKSELQWRS